MFRYTLIFASLSCIAVANVGTAQSNNVAGVWEATVRPNEYVDHHVLRFDDGSYEYTILSNDPDSPLRSDSGSFSQIDGTITFSSSEGVQLADTLSLSADGASLLNRTHSIEFRPGREFEGNIYGTWAFLDSDGQPTGSTFAAFQDGTFETDVSTGHEAGWFVIAGSAMVHFPTEASNERLLGVPGLWTNLNVSSDILSYTISNIGVGIIARRVIASLIANATWADVKFSVVGIRAHNGR